MTCFEKPLTFSSSGYELSAYVHMPSLGSSSMVLMLHGFTGNKVEAYRLFVDIARALCREGIGVLRFDYRCHGDSPLDFEDFRFDYAEEDAVNALEFMVGSYSPKRIGLIGLSMGGHIAVKLAARHGSTVSGAVLLAPALDFIELGKRSMHVVQKIDEYYVLGPQRIREEGMISFAKSNAIELANRITVPMLIIHAKDDQTVPYTQSLEFFERLSSQDKRLMLLDEGGHIFATYRSRTTVVKEVVGWLKDRLVSI